MATTLRAFALRPWAPSETCAPNDLARCASSAAGRACSPWRRVTTRVRAASAPIGCRAGAACGCAAAAMRVPCMPVDFEQQLTRRHRTRRAAPAQAQAVHRRHDDGRHQTLGAARHDVEIEADQLIAGSDDGARADARLESAPAQLQRCRCRCESTRRCHERLRIDTACALAGSVMISPAQGARSTPLVGSMARPSPSMRPANTGSGTSSSGAHQPSNGARISRLDIRRLLPDLDPIERPHGIEARTCEAQAQIVPARQARQSLRRQRRHARRCAAAGASGSTASAGVSQPST